MYIKAQVCFLRQKSYQLPCDQHTFTYESIIDNFNMYKILILEKIVRVLQTKETKLNDLGIIKEKSINFVVQGDFWGGQGDWGK